MQEWPALTTGLRVREQVLTSFGVPHIFLTVAVWLSNCEKWKHKLLLYRTAAEPKSPGFGEEGKQVRNTETDGTVRWNEFLGGSAAGRRGTLSMVKYGNSSCHSCCLFYKSKAGWADCLRSLPCAQTQEDSFAGKCGTMQMGEVGELQLLERDWRLNWMLPKLTAGRWAELDAGTQREVQLACPAMVNSKECNGTNLTPQRDTNWNDSDSKCESAEDWDKFVIKAYLHWQSVSVIVHYSLPS